MSNSGSQVDISASATMADRGGGTSGDDRPARPAQPSPTPTCTDAIDCRGNYSVWMPPTVTIDDLASFRPAPPAVQTEPAGFAVRGLPTNFIAAAATHESTGTLLGYPVAVRFIPTRYTFDHGDGTTATTMTGGSSWASVAAPQFTPTATTHVYRTPGTVTPSVRVGFAASVDFGTGWRPVPGTLTLIATAAPVRIVEAHTALVQHTCTETPTAPGC